MVKSAVFGELWIWVRSGMRLASGLAIASYSHRSKICGAGSFKNQLRLSHAHIGVLKYMALVDD